MTQKFQKIFSSEFAVLALFTVVAFSLVFNTLKVIQRNYALQEQVDQLADEVALVEVQNQRLRFDIEYYKTDEYLEVEAKRRFNLSEKGEKVVFLEKDGDPEVEPVTAVESSALDEEVSNFDKWMIFFFGGGNG